MGIKKNEIGLLQAHPSAFPLNSFRRKHLAENAGCATGLQHNILISLAFIKNIRVRRGKNTRIRSPVRPK